MTSQLRPARIATAMAVLAVALAPTARAAASCTDGDADWPYYSGPGLGARNQTETSIGPDEAATLAPAWALRTTSVGGGAIQSTPVLTGGCVLITTDAGVVAALDEATGEVVWSKKIDPRGKSGALGGTIVGSPAIVDGMAIIGVSRDTKPFVTALSLADGSVLWETTIDDHPGNYISASPVITGDLIFMGIAGDEYGTTARGGYAFLELDGDLVTKRYTINDAEYALGHRGASIWSTGAYDPVSEHVFVGGGNPAKKTLEHRYANALLKIDTDRTSPTFAEIVDAYKGNVDQYYPGLDRQPVCENFGEAQPNLPAYPWSVACVQFDIDFGASPSLWYGADGELYLGDLQKSGIYHTVFADNMQLAWTSVIPGAPCFACNASSPATDGEQVYAAGTPGGTLTAVTADGGKYRWALPLAEGLHFQSVTTAKGVVYSTTSNGLFLAVDAATGTPLSVRSYLADAGDRGTGLFSSGISVGDDRVFAALGGTLLVLRPTV